MSFLHPGFLWLAPLLAVPVLIHLLNRIRYRRVRWAAIEFLLNSERRAVRRARLRHLLLLICRTLLLAAALGVLLQPILRGSLAAILGATSQLAVLVDASASMSLTDASGCAFDRAQDLAKETISSLPHGTKATAGTFTTRYEPPFREPLQDRGAVVSVVEGAQRSAGAANVPEAIRAAAAILERSGGGGTIWLLTDLQAAGWRAFDTGAWEQARRALEHAGRPAVVVTDLVTGADANFSVMELRTTPAMLVEGDVPRLTATIRLHGSAGGVTNVSLFFDGRRVDSRIVQFDAPGRSEVVFHLPQVTAGVHTGYLELSPDAVPADDRRHFLLRVTDRIPLLLVDGAPSSIPFEGAADFLALAIQPPEPDASTRSPFSVKTITLQQLPGVDLRGFAAVLLADVPQLGAEAVRTLREYVEAGGLAIMFPGSHTDVIAWNRCELPGVPVKEVVEAPEKGAFMVNWTSPASPVVSALPAEGLDRLSIRKLFRLDADSAGRVLASTAEGDPFLVRRQVGRGKVYLFAVSCQTDCSNLPFTPVLLLAIHRAVSAHMVEVGEPLSRPAFTALDLPLPPGRCQVLAPDGKLFPLLSDSGSPGTTTFDRTGLSGIYRLVEGDVKPEEARDAPALVAINVPAEESELERIDEQTVRDLLGGYRVNFLRANGGAQQLGSGGGRQSAASGFPLAVLAVMFLLGEVLLGWLIDRPAGTDSGKAGSA